MSSAVTSALAEIATHQSIDALLLSGAACVISCSGGKDSQVAAIATARHLDAIGHRGPRVVIHADLGMVEWSQSLTHSEEIAKLIGGQFVVVRRKAGGLMERWESRWQSSVRRYANLETVTLVLPWSTPSMRFCTSELKTHVIEAELKRRFPFQSVVNVTGIRREESAARARSTVFDIRTHPRTGVSHADWRPILDWKLRDVWSCIEVSGLSGHHAYKLGMSRVSCVICIMSNTSDMKIASAQPENLEVVRRMVHLEAASTFGFQGSRWLADIAESTIEDDLKAAVQQAKAAATIRQLAESRIPKGLLYTKGWPTRMPTSEEAELLAQVRQTVGQAVGIQIGYGDRRSILDRYAELMALKEKKRVRCMPDLFGFDPEALLGQVKRFASGVAAPAIWAGYAAERVPMCLVVANLGQAGVERAINYRRSGGELLLDSGAFEYRGRANQLDWLKVLAAYRTISEASPSPTAVILPDVVGDQEASLELARQHNKALLDLRGHELLVPIQRGALSIADYLQRYISAIGFAPSGLAIPSNAAAMPPQALVDLAQLRNLPRRVHFLGISRRSHQLAERVERVINIWPEAVISADACEHRGEVGATRPITLERARVLATMAEIERIELDDTEDEGWNEAETTIRREIPDLSDEELNDVLCSSWGVFAFWESANAQILRRNGVKATQASITSFARRRFKTAGSAIEDIEGAVHS